MFMPEKMTDIELCEPLSAIEGLHGYSFLQALVRVHGSPIGYVRMPVINGSCSRSDIANAILEKHASPIIQQLLFEGLSRNISPGFRSITDLLRNQQPANMPLSGPLVTVVVCTRDNTALLSACLESLSRLDYPNLDIVIIDNAPVSDSTKCLVTTKYQNMRYFREERPGLDWARNRAIIEARGEIIAYTDDDVVVDKGWITALVRIFGQNSEVMAVTGLVVPYELETESQELFELYSGFGRGFDRKWIRVDSRSGKKLATLHGGTGKFGTGANMAFRLKLFEEIGSFDPALDVGTVTNGGGDLDMFFRVLKEGHTLVYEPNAIVRHCHRRNYAELRAQMTNWGIGFFSYLTRNALAYPDERVAFVKLGLWWFYKKIHAVLISYAYPSCLRDLYKAELHGSFIGLFRYYKACSAMKRIVDKFGPLSGSSAVHPANPRKHTPFSNKASAARSVELSVPLTELTGLDDYARVQILATFKDRPLGTVSVDAYGFPVSKTRLCQAIVAGLGLKLLDSDGCRKPESLKSEAYAALRRYLMQDEVSADVADAKRLPSDVNVSIVLATYDRPSDLSTCIRHLKAQKSSRRIEIIVVDNNPASGLTRQVLAEFPDIIPVSEPRQGLSYARNAGIRKSAGDIIVTIDDDVAMPPHWLEELVAPFVRSDVMIVTGNVLPMELETTAQHLFEEYGGLGRGFKNLEFDRRWFESSVRRAVPTWKIGATANAAFRAAIFSNPQIGMMDEALGAGTPTGCSEDTYVFYKVLKAGYTILYNPAAYLWHRHRRDIRALRRQIYNYSKGHVAYHLTTLILEHDLRALIRLFIELPQAHIRRMRQQVFGKGSYPFSLTLMEIAGNLAGPFSLWRSRRRVRRLGVSQPYVPISDRFGYDRSIAEARGTLPASIPGTRNNCSPD
jgi:glycosyltransferase involved in cell wall biosynthesis